jgi:LPXTG-motif cell wall-anchored protein
VGQAWFGRVLRRSRLITALLGAAMLTILVVGSVSTDASWLDQPPRPWNKAGAAIPTAPPARLAQQICTSKERGATNAEESLVARAGWRLESYWPILRRGNLAIVLALSDYDGMCRPLGFNAFVFASGTYAGTLSPVNLNSRTDGVFNRTPELPADGMIQAIYTRYAPTDPLCCPSRPATIVTYGLINGAIAPLTIATVASTRTPVPMALPRTGDGVNPLLAAALGLLLLLAGLAVRK